MAIESLAEMATPPTSRVQCMLQASVQAVEWTYSLFWQLCPQQGVLVWGDGYYNGAIKTRKTVQPMVVSDEETSLQRSQQLRDLYDSLSAGESNQQARRPCAALSPEDLTESEWFYLMCVSFTFPSGVGLPGKAYAKRKHLWLTGANEVDSKVFSRAILAKSARIQTVVCIPLLDGVVEFGTTERIQEDHGFLQHVKSFFIDHHRPHPPKPALSEHSTSNPTASSEHALFPSPSLPPVYAAVDPTSNTSRIEEEEGDEDGDEEGESDSESETRRNSHLSGVQNPYSSTAALGVAVVHTAAEPSELMQLEMSEDIRLGSPDNDSNNLDSDFHILGGSQGAGNPADSYRTESTHRWPFLQDPLNGSLQPPTSGGLPLDESMREDSHYSLTVSALLENQSSRRPDSSSTTAGYVMYSSDSAFVEWTNRSDYHLHVPVEGTSQWLLKYILFSVPFLHPKSRDDVIGSPKSRDAASDSASRFRKATAQDELSANHVLAERRRREKLNERFIVLRSLVPFVTKMDKASILGDTIEYLKQLRKKIQDLEARTRQMELDQRSRGLPQVSGVTVVDRARVSSPSDKKKLRIVEGSGGAKPKAIHSQPPPTPPPPPRLPSAGVDLEVEVSIIEGDGLVEMQCPYREGLLLDVMKILRELRVEITTVQSSLTNGVFVAELRAKVKENVNGRRASIAEVKRAIRQSIPTTSASSICS